MARTSLLGLFAGLGVLFTGGAAAAQCCAPPTPPTCCAPPPCCTPPPPPPPTAPPCCTPGHNVNVPGVNVFVAGSVVVNAQANARASAGASAGSGSVVFFGGGGNVGGFAPPMSTGVIQGLNVGGGVKRTAYQATRSKMTRVVIQAVCIDDRFVAHPASQTRPDREIDDAFEGELYRCMAGTRMQYTVSEYLGKIDFSKGETKACAKGEALYKTAGGSRGLSGGPASAGGVLECRKQKPARDCNERSLLRRFGAGVKILTMTIVETYTAYREEASESVVTSMSLDGGVGGVVY